MGNNLSFFADENISSDIINWFKENNFEISSIYITYQFGIADKSIIEQCFEKKQIILTQDADFGRLVYTTTINFYSIIYLRPEHFDGAFHITTIERILKHKHLIKERTLIVATRELDKIKIRIKNII